MILAYRRGLLKPDYPNGVQSRLREEMILQALAAELDAEFFSRVASLAASIWSPHVAHKSVRKFAKQLNAQLDHAMDRMEYSDKKYHSQADIDAKFLDQAREYFEALHAASSAPGQD